MMLSSRALCCLRQWRSKNMTSRFASLTDLDRARKIFGDKDSQNTKRSTKVAKELFADYVKEKKLREPVYRYIYTFRNKLSVPLTVETIFFGSMYNKTIIRFGFCYIQNNQPSASADNPYLDLNYSGYLHVYYTFNSLSLFWLAESVQWIFKISAWDVI